MPNNQRLAVVQSNVVCDNHVKKFKHHKKIDDLKVLEEVNLFADTYYEGNIDRHRATFHRLLDFYLRNDVIDLNIKNFHIKNIDKHISAYPTYREYCLEGFISSLKADLNGPFPISHNINEDHIRAKLGSKTDVSKYIYCSSILLFIEFQRKNYEKIAIIEGGAIQARKGLSDRAAKSILSYGCYTFWLCIVLGALAIFAGGITVGVCSEKVPFCPPDNNSNYTIPDHEDVPCTITTCDSDGDNCKTGPGFCRIDYCRRDPSTVIADDINNIPGSDGNSLNISTITITNTITQTLSPVLQNVTQLISQTFSPILKNTTDIDENTDEGALPGQPQAAPVAIDRVLAGEKFRSCFWPGIITLSSGGGMILAAFILPFLLCLGCIVLSAIFNRCKNRKAYRDNKNISVEKEISKQIEALSIHFLGPLTVPNRQNARGIVHHMPVFTGHLRMTTCSSHGFILDHDDQIEQGFGFQSGPAL